MIISDTAGRPWRIGQTDHAIGVSGVQPLQTMQVSGTVRNELQVTVMAVADELAAAGDLVKGKLRGRPIAVVRGLGQLLGQAESSARELLRDPAKDMFGFGSQEAVLAAALAAHWTAPSL